MELTAITRRQGPIELLLADKRSEHTRAAYRADLVDFFAGVPDDAQLERFFTQSASELAYQLATYKAGLLERSLAPATVNRRLAAVRSLLKFAHRLGLCGVDPRGLVDGERVTAYRDTRGITAIETAKLLTAPDRRTLKGKRDHAILLIFLENALRRAEVQRLDLGDYDGAHLAICGKGRAGQKETISISGRAAAAIDDYLEATGRTRGGDGALFLSHPLEWLGEPQRITASGLNKMVAHYGRSAGIERKLSPHRLRHTSITMALDTMGGDVRKVQRFSRHAKVETLLIYDDSRADHQGEITRRLSAALEEGEMDGRTDDSQAGG